jgi:hypothetical protein
MRVSPQSGGLANHAAFHERNRINLDDTCAFTGRAPACRFDLCAPIVATRLASRQFRS